MIGRRALGALLLLSVACATAPKAKPGGVLVWSESETCECRADGRRWLPYDGRCFFPIDLLAAAGPKTVFRRCGSDVESLTFDVDDYPYEVQRLEIPEELTVPGSSRAVEEAKRMATLWAERRPPRFELPLGRPLMDLPPGGRFGSRRVINGHPASPHTGADYPAPLGTPVLAVAAGTVVLAEEHFFPGRAVVIDHGDELLSMYFHLDQIDVEACMEVERGQPIGRVGSTGRATGPHLHFGLRWRGARIDPSALLETQADGEPW